MGQGAVPPLNPPFFQKRDRCNELFGCHIDAQVLGIKVQGLKSGVVENGGKGVSDGVAQYAVPGTTRR